ncbi:Type II secretion system (T2SS), protein F [Lachnospiraceae bacterium RM5]|nr:Type II secretion system (T2SS), protein F [Lachnospiraceae bacterium RM5]
MVIVYTIVFFFINIILLIFPFKEKKEYISRLKNMEKKYIFILNFFGGISLFIIMFVNRKIKQLPLYKMKDGMEKINLKTFDNKDVIAILIYRLCLSLLASDICLILGVFREDLKFKSVLLALISGVVVFILFFNNDKNILDKRKEELEMDYVSIVEKIAILQEAGLSILPAFERILKDYEEEKEFKYAYEEIKLLKYRMENGMSETESISVFGKRCGLSSYIKLANLLEQNIKKGTKGVSVILRGEVYEAYEKRKTLIKAKSDRTSTKLLFPMGILLVISMAMVMIPALMSFKL